MSPHILNLLPPENRNRLGYEQMARFFILVFSTMAAILLTGAILLLPTYFFLFFETKGLDAQVATAELAARSEETQKTETLIRETNTNLKWLKRDHPLSPSFVTRHYAAIAAEMPPALTLLSFSYQKKGAAISIRGKAARRGDLIQFMENLRNRAEFTNIQSPVANLLKEENIDFTLSLTLTGESEPQ